MPANHLHDFHSFFSSGVFLLSLTIHVSLMWPTPFLLLSLYALNSLWFALNTHNCLTTDSCLFIQNVLHRARGVKCVCNKWKRTFAVFHDQWELKWQKWHHNYDLTIADETWRETFPFCSSTNTKLKRKKVCLFTWTHCDVCCCSCKRLTIVEPVRREKLFSSSVLGYFISRGNVKSFWLVFKLICWYLPDNCNL